MNFIHKQFRIEGMTCVNCKNKIEHKLRDTVGIKEAVVSYSKGTGRISYDADIISWSDIIAIIEKLDYIVLTEQEENEADITRIISLLVIIISLYVMLQRFGILNLLVPSRLADTGMGYGMMFIVGILTSVHCIAMCGGINLTQCISNKTTLMKNHKLSVFRPAFLYNFGRVISYTVIGFILGLAGMVLGGGSGIGLPAPVQGIPKLIAGVFMVITGINMLKIFPWLRKFNPRIPNFLALGVRKHTGKINQSLVVGLLNGLMPCGPLQSMQIVALASGSPFVGAISMFLFSLGTVPLMLGLGSIIAALGKKFIQKVMSIGAVLVIVLGLAMFSQGGSLSGMLLPEHLLVLVISLSILGVIGSIPFSRTWYRPVSLLAAAAIMIVGGTVWKHNVEESNRKEAASSAENLEIVDDIQIVRSTLAPGSYPNITVQTGIPVKWLIDAPEGSINGCNYKMLLEEYGIEYSFQQGENIIEFTPEKTGAYGYTCWMGMIHGNIVVTDGKGAAAVSKGKGI